MGGIRGTRDWQQEVAENARKFRALQDRLSGQTIREVSRDGTVEVTVSTSGVLTDLVLREGRHRDSLPMIAAEVMACVRRAQARIPDLVDQAMADTVGRHDPGAHLILADARQRFPEPEPVQPGAPPTAPAQHGQAVPPRRVGTSPDADDWDGPEIFDRT